MKAARQDTVAIKDPATVRIPAVYAAVFVRRTGELRASAVEDEHFGVDGDSEEGKGLAAAILRVLNQVDEGGSGDLELTAPADLLRRLLGWCIPNDAENIASIWDGRRDGQMRQIADRLLFWIKTREALGGRGCRGGCGREE